MWKLALARRYRGRGFRGPSGTTTRLLWFSTGRAWIRAAKLRRRPFAGLKSDLKQPAAECNGYRVRSVVGTQFVDEVLYVEVNRGLRDRELIGNLFVPIAIANEPQHLQLARCEILF